MSRWDPWRELFLMPREISQLFNDDLGGAGSSAGTPTVYLPLDIRQTDSEFILEASVPGFAPEQIDVVAEQGTLTIRGERRMETEEQGRYLRRERRQSSFLRQLSLPSEVNESEITAHFENGILRVRIPRVTAPAPTRIKVEVGAGAAALEAAPPSAVESSSQPA